MNKNEEVAHNWLKDQGIQSEKIDSVLGLPDFESEEKYYEVKSEDSYNPISRLLSPLQKKVFPRLNKPVFMIFVHGKKVIRCEQYNPSIHDSYKGKNIVADFEDEDFNKLNALRGLLSWREFILKISGIKY